MLGHKSHVADDLAYFNDFAIHGEFVYDSALRDRAVQVVDARHGYSIEFSPGPGAHAAEYDLEEVHLHRERAAAREPEGAAGSPDA